MSSTHNILVISDLHLGEGLEPQNPSSTTSYDVLLAERQLVEFLRTYTRRRADGKPWRLVINGDMIDFVSMCVYPARKSDQDTPRPQDASEFSSWLLEERTYGLQRRLDAACAQVRAVLRYHRAFFEALASFLAAGNALEITSGNHDTEFFWPEVQEVLTDGIVDIWAHMAEAARPGAMSLAELRARIRFHHWFYYEPGVAWIEHGHQYDDCCSYEYNFHPVDKTGQVMDTNVDTAAMRYLNNQLSERAHGSEEWSGMGYLRFAAGLGWRGAWRMVRGYHMFATSLLRQWRMARISRSRRTRRRIHRERLRELASRSALPESVLRQLDGLQRPPVITRLLPILQAVMLDKVIIWLLALVVVLGMWMTTPLWMAALATALAVPGGLQVIHWLDRKRSVDPVLPLRLAPASIARLIDVRYVIFGHTHQPLAEQAAPPDAVRDTWYLNTGTWVPTGKQGLLNSFTHAVIRVTPRGAVEGGLCQWRDGASQAFEPAESSNAEPAVGKPALRPALFEQPERQLAPVGRREAV